MTTIEKVTAENDEIWRRLEVPLINGMDFEVGFIATRKNIDVDGYIAIDDISFTPECQFANKKVLQFRPQRFSQMENVTPGKSSNAETTLASQRGKSVTLKMIVLLEKTNRGVTGYVTSKVPVSGSRIKIGHTRCPFHSYIQEGSSRRSSSCTGQRQHKEDCSWSLSAHISY